MKGHTVMYVIMALVAVLLISRAASTAGVMLAGGSVITNESQVLTGQFLPKTTGGNFQINTPGGKTSFSLG